MARRWVTIKLIETGSLVHWFTQRSEKQPFENCKDYLQGEGSIWTEAKGYCPVRMGLGRWRLKKEKESWRLTLCPVCLRAILEVRHVGKPGVQLECQEPSVCSAVLTVSSVRECMLANCRAIGLSSYDNSLVKSLWLSRQRKKAAGSRKGKKQS